MASRATLTIVFGYAAAFWCLQLLREAEKKAQTPQASTFPRRTLLPAVVATFGLTSLLLCAHVRALGHRADAAAAAGAARRRLVVVNRLASATLGATTVALLLGAVLLLRLVADGAGWVDTE
ncbi:hypothetical protein BS78_10G076700 [Paspalum vaginatum]|nr:hypothetical protein BS78_10G076700 [Paspalum vaginatum]